MIPHGWRFIFWRNGYERGDSLGYFIVGFQSSVSLKLYSRISFVSFVLRLLIVCFGIDSSMRCVFGTESEHLLHYRKLPNLIKILCIVRLKMTNPTTGVWSWFELELGYL